jgi:hypothetical protein
LLTISKYRRPVQGSSEDRRNRARFFRSAGTSPENPSFGVCLHLLALVVFRFVAGTLVKETWLYFLDLPYTRIISFPLFFLYISAATAGHINGVEGYKNGVKKAVLVTKTEWRSHERSEHNRSL